MNEEKMTHIVGTISGMLGSISFVMIFLSQSIFATVLFGVATFLLLTMFKNYMGMWMRTVTKRTTPLCIPLPEGEEIVIQDVEDPIEVRAALEMLDNDMLKVLVKSLAALVQEDSTFRCGVVNEILIEVIAERGEEFYNEE